MTKLKLSAIEDDKPIKLNIEIPAAVHRNLVAYAEAIGREGGQAAPEPGKLIAPMIERFMATDRGFRQSAKIGLKRSPMVRRNHFVKWYAVVAVAIHRKWCPYSSEYTQIRRRDDD